MDEAPSQVDAGIPRPSLVSSILIAVVSVLAVALALSPLHDRISPTTAALTLLVVVLVVATRRGLAPALAASFAGMLGFNYFFLPPVHTFTVADPENWVALAAFLATAVVAGQLSARAKRRAEEAEDRQRQIQQLYADLQNAFDRAASAEADRQAERMRSALLDAVTHELRTPLTGIKASVTALLSDATESQRDEPPLAADDRREMLLVIDEEADRLNRYIGNLMDLAKIEAGSLPLRRSWTAPSVIAREAVDRVRRRRGTQPIRVAVAPDTPAIFVDGRSLAEALFMLIDNAIKYSPADSPVFVSVYAAAGDTVEFAVEDEGPGIPPHLRDRVFEKLFRAMDPESSGPGGTGMGLAIARGIVEAHDGTIRIEDRPDARGARVVIRVAVGDDEGHEPVPRESVATEEA
jgi:two-component system sensor histidine kinase KdpD